jgi:hypothetical protein
MNNRVIGVAVALVAVLAAVGFEPAASAAQSAPTVSLVGELIQLADHSGPAMAAIRTADNQLVPVEAAALTRLKPGSVLTVNVVVPANVREAAATNSTLTLRRADGKTTATSLTAGDLAAAGDGTAEPAKSDLAKAAIASAVSTGLPLAVSAVISVADPVGSYTPAIRHLFVAIVTPKGWSTPNAVTQTQIRTQVANASTYWSNVSGGAISLALTTITAPYPSAFNCTNPLSLWSEAATKAGFKDDPNTSLVVELPAHIDQSPASGCSYGLGTIGANVNTDAMAYISDNAFPGLAHELGHKRTAPPWQSSPSCPGPVGSRTHPCPGCGRRRRGLGPVQCRLWVPRPVGERLP